MRLEIEIATFTFHLGMFIMGIVFWLLVIGLVAVVLVSSRYIDELMEELSGDKKPPKDP